MTFEQYAKNLLDSELLYEIKTDIKIPSRYIGYVLSKNHIPSFSTKKLIEIINDNNNLNIKNELFKFNVNNIRFI